MTDLYQQLWNPSAYLKQYYSTDHVADDEKAIFEFVIQWLKQSKKTFTCGVDFGCGCTLHHIMPFIPHVKEIHLADYLPENLEEIQKWIDGSSEAHNWDVYLHGVLDLEENPQTSANNLEYFKQSIRNKITTLKLGDIRHKHPLNDGSLYDLVMSFYCVEAVTSSKAEWQVLMSNLCRLLAPGGTLILSAIRNCQFYKVMENQFPLTYINETDLEAVLAQNGFDPTRTEIQVTQIAEWAEQGFDGICIVRAEKLS